MNGFGKVWATIWEKQTFTCDLQLTQNLTQNGSYFNVEYKMIKLLEENRGENLFDLRLTPREKLVKDW